MQAATGRPVQALRAPVSAARALHSLSANRNAIASLTAFRTGTPLRLNAFGNVHSNVARQRLTVSSAAATEVKEETHEYQAEVLTGLSTLP